MKQLRIYVLASLVIGGITVWGFTPDEEKFQKMMKGAKAATNSWKKNLEEKKAKPAEKDARQVADLFEGMAKWWDGKKLGKPSKWSMESAALASASADAARKGDLAVAREKFDAYMKSCRECHSAHREKVDGDYRFKY